VAAAPSLPWFFAAWILAGFAQSAVLYPPAFAALTRWYGPHRIRALTTLSLVGGLASTVFAPLTAALVDLLDWRAAYVVLAVLLGVVTIPLHALCLTPPWPSDGERGRRRRAGHVDAVLRDRAFWFLVVAMMLGAFGMYAATVDLAPLLTSQGTSNVLAAVALGLCGVGQVLGRLGYARLADRTSPRTRTMAILAGGAVTIVLLAALPRHTAALLTVAVLAGAVRGIHTLLQATAVSDRWGTRHFATLNGVFSAPTVAAIAVAPGGAALLAEWLGSYPTAFAMLAVIVLLGTVAAAGTNVPHAPGGSPGES
jgi:predicted MFS family arabinose efflux permease